MAMRFPFYAKINKPRRAPDKPLENKGRKVLVSVPLAMGWAAGAPHSVTPAWWWALSKTTPLEAAQNSLPPFPWLSHKGFCARWMFPLPGEHLVGSRCPSCAAKGTLKKYISLAWWGTGVSSGTSPLLGSGRGQPRGATLWKGRRWRLKRAFASHALHHGGFVEITRPLWPSVSSSETGGDEHP